MFPGLGGAAIGSSPPPSLKAKNIVKRSGKNVESPSPQKLGVGLPPKTVHTNAHNLSQGVNTSEPASPEKTVFSNQILQQYQHSSQNFSIELQTLTPQKVKDYQPSQVPGSN